VSDVDYQVREKYEDTMVDVDWLTLPDAVRTGNLIEFRSGGWGRCPIADIRKKRTSRSLGQQEIR